jgi:acyl-CoA thioester hydrolase
MVYEYERRVSFAETDMAGVAQFTAQLRWVEEAEAAFYRTSNHDLCRREAGGMITGWPRVALSAEYLTPVHFDDVVVVTIELVREGRSSREWRFQIRRTADSAEISRGVMKSVYVTITHDGKMTPKIID